MHTKTNTSLTAFLIALLLPFSALSAGEGPVSGAQALFATGQPFEQDVVITAYYSPLPDQCCYIKGSLAADMELNGQGVRGADGTEVYPGMAAAPPVYPFGTRIVLPGIGTVTVHDRGGAIQVQQAAHRLDLWVGSGEEGLARAIAFGVKRVRATVYPLSSAQPGESMNLASLPAPPERLMPYLSQSATLFDLHISRGDQTASVQFLQERLRTLGYFTEKINGVFGPATEQSLQQFIADSGLGEPADHLTEKTAAYLEAAHGRTKAAEPVALLVDPSSAPSRIAEAQRTLRFLGFYNGRTNGQYDTTFTSAVLAFQHDQKIVTSDQSPGAGRIGPQTRKKIVTLWKQKLTAMSAGRLLAARKIDQLLAQRGLHINRYLERGDKGDPVRALQKFLLTKGYLVKEDVTGAFGAKTEQALVAYQTDAGIISGTADAGAGFVGPATLAAYRRDLRTTMLKIVRAEGWDAI